MSDESQDIPATPDEPTTGNDWQPPASQADLDRIIQNRLERERAKFADIDELREKAQNWDQIAEASKTEYERLQESFEANRRETETALAEAETARAEAARYKVAATYGIPADHFDLLGSGTEDEIAARAEKLAALITARNQPAAPSAPQRRPVEQLRPGATPSGAESESDVVYASLFGK